MHHIESDPSSTCSSEWNCEPREVMKIDGSSLVVIGHNRHVPSLHHGNLILLQGTLARESQGEKCSVSKDFLAVFPIKGDTTCGVPPKGEERSEIAKASINGWARVTLRVVVLDA